MKGIRFRSTTLHKHVSVHCFSHPQRMHQGKICTRVWSPLVLAKIRPHEVPPFSSEGGGATPFSLSATVSNGFGGPRHQPDGSNCVQLQSGEWNPFGFAAPVRGLVPHVQHGLRVGEQSDHYRRELQGPVVSLPWKIEVRLQRDAPWVGPK